MTAGAKMVLIGVLAGVAGLVGGYLLGRSGEAIGLSAGGKDSLVVGRSPLLVTGSEKGSGGTGLISTPSAGLPDVDVLLSSKGSLGESIEEILEQPGPMGRWKAMMALAISGDGEAIATALEDLKDMPQSIDTIVSRFFLYSSYAEGDPGAAMDAMGDLPDDELELAKVSILGGWAGEDPQAAAAYLLQSANEDGNLEGVNGRVLGSVVNEWARLDPQAAFEWSLGLGEESRFEAVKNVMEKWAWSSPADAAAAVARFPEEGRRHDLYEKVAEQWAERDFQSALSWAESLPGEEGEDARAVAAMAWAEESPQGAAQYHAGMEEGDAKDRVLRSVASEWAKDDPEGALGWVMGQPKSNGQHRAFLDVVSQWTNKDSMAASSWISEQPAGETTDTAIIAMSGAVQHKDPEGAAIWAGAITNPNMRKNQMKAIASNWLRRDKAAARAWIQSADMPEDLRTELLAK